MANRVLPTSKMILSLTMSSTAGHFGNSMMRFTPCGFSLSALLFPTWSAFLGCEPGHCHRRRLYVYDTGFSLSALLFPTWSAFLGCEPGHCHRRRLYVYDTGTARSTWWRSRRCSEPHAILRNLQGASEYSSSTGSCGNSMTRYIGCGSPLATLLPPICNNRDHRLFIDLICAHLALWT